MPVCLLAFLCCMYACWMFFCLFVCLLSVCISLVHVLCCVLVCLSLVICGAGVFRVYSECQQHYCYWLRSRISVLHVRLLCVSFTVFVCCICACRVPRLYLYRILFCAVRLYSRASCQRQDLYLCTLAGARELDLWTRRWRRSSARYGGSLWMLVAVNDVYRRFRAVIIRSTV